MQTTIHRTLLVSLLSSCLMMAQTAFAEIPSNCQQQGFKFFKNWLVLGTGEDTTQQAYLLNNHSEQTLVLDHPHEGGSAKAGWVTELAPGNWSVIAVAKNDFALSCYRERDTGVRREVACRQVLKACALPAVALTNTTNKQNYWLIENTPWQALLDELKARHIAWVPSQDQEQQSS